MFFPTSPVVVVIKKYSRTTKNNCSRKTMIADLGLLVTFFFLLLPIYVARLRNRNFCILQFARTQKPQPRLQHKDNNYD